ncbi:MAG: hypothetical protein M1828_005103 [Chrysothrix sp. TS-e1954]|nr:MAG: hypothetical protein M1828_005103 [Chrysothrix sp. TS-e1954]
MDDFEEYPEALGGRCYEHGLLPSPFSTPQADEKVEKSTQLQETNPSSILSLDAEVSESQANIPKHNKKATFPTNTYLALSSTASDENSQTFRNISEATSERLATEKRAYDTMTTSASSSFQMYTPPPTRHSSKRKPQQPAMNFNITPDTHVRRQSAPGEAWLKRGEEMALPEASPFSITPFQYSTTDFAPFSNPGPATAPTYPQAGLFWDPNSNMDLSSLNDLGSNLHTTTSHSHAMSYDHFPMSDPITQPVRQSEPAQRPQSSHAFGMGQSSQNLASLDGGVNPSMLWSTQGSDLGQLLIPDAAPSHFNDDGRQPYQYYFEELKREKEQRARRQNAQVEISGAATLAGHSLRRGLNQLRVSKQKPRKKDSASSSEASDIRREGSPLKRHKSDATDRLTTSARSSLRRSVVLEVDEKGRARTVITTIPESGQASSAGTAVDVESDSDDDRSRTESSTAQDNAQDALRSMRDGKQRQSGGLESFSNAVKALSVHPPSNRRNADTWNTVSQADTISDSDYMTPEKAKGLPLEGNVTHCVCGNTVPNEDQFMVQCESCNNWLHVACLGLNPHRMPSVFVCVFCTGNTPTVRGGRVRHYPNQSFAMG